MADSPQAPQAQMPTPAPPTAAALQLLLTQLGQYEPDIADEIKRAYLHLTPTHRPLLLLQSPQFRRLQAAVQALPRGWRSATRHTPKPTIQEQFRTILDTIPPDLLALIPQIVLPPASRVRVEARARGPPGHAQPGFFQLFHAWQTVRNSAPPEDFPIAVLDARHPRIEHRHIPLLHHQQVLHWRDPRRSGPNHTPLFASLFPTDVGRLLYAAAAFIKHNAPAHYGHHPAGIWSRLLSQHARDYNQIKKAHTPFSPHDARLKLEQDRRWIMGLGPLKPH
jgi:hypothetical protein